MGRLRTQLVDQYGRPVASSAAWDGAGQGRRARTWNPTTSHVNALLAGDVARLRTRMRDAVRRSPWADNALEVRVANEVGSGITPQPISSDEKWRVALVDAWEEWTEQCDADGTLDFYGQQALVARGRLEGGEVFVRLRPRRKEDGLAVPLQCQLLEAEMLDPAFNEDRPGRLIRAGIEFDTVGRRVAYHFFREHPGDMRGFRGAVRTRVPAEEVLHVYRPLRPGQIRGIPEASSTLAKVHEIEQVADARVMREKIQNLLVGFIRKPPDNMNPLGAGSAGTDDDDVPLVALEPGTMQELLPGEEVSFSQPPGDGGGFEAFIKNELRSIAMGWGITYEQLSGDLAGVTFSSIRAGLIEFRRRMEQIQYHVLIHQLCRPIWARWIETAILAGRVTVPADFAQRPRAYLRAKWQPPGWAYVDPVKEVTSLIKAISAGLISRSEVIAQYGYDATSIDNEIAADNARADRLGLVLDSDARHTLDKKAGLEDVDAPTDDDDEEEEGANAKRSANA
jgi:lambda family phage portal protein